MSFCECKRLDKMKSLCLIKECFKKLARDMFLLSNTLEEGAFAFSLTIGIQNSGLKTVVFLANISRPEKVRPAPVVYRAIRQLPGPLRAPLGLFYRYQKGFQKVVRKTLHGHNIFPFMCVEVLLCQLVASRVKKRLYSTTTHTHTILLCFFTTVVCSTN